MDNPRILVAPLDWGLGHASRCIPIIQELLSLKCTVVIAGDGNSLSLLKKEFPNQEFLDLKNHQIAYPSSGNMTWHFLFKLPAMFKQLRSEHSALKEIIEEKNIDAVISDNRYGLYNKNLPCVLITHQINPPVNYFASLVQKKVRQLISRFDQCWIPDYKDKESLAGAISKVDSESISAVYIGHLSRFKPSSKEKKYRSLSILSGPEPQRSMLEKEVLYQLPSLSGKHLVIRGSESLPSVDSPSTVEMIDMSSGKSLEDFIDTSECLISRSGYSSIMDYMAKGRKALLIPTPGQPEQLFLADRLKGGQQFIIQKQNRLDIKKALDELASLPDPRPLKNNVILKEVLEDFCESIY